MNCFRKTFQLQNGDEETQGERPTGDCVDHSVEGLAEERQKNGQILDML